MEEIRKRRSFFKLKVDSLSRTEVPMLDVKVSKGLHYERTGMLDVSPYIKDTALRVYLHSDSCHPPASHVAWPVGRVKHYMNFSTSASDGLRSGLDFLSTMLHTCPNHSAIVGVCEAICNVKRPMKNHRQNCSWCIIPFHPVWGNAGLGKLAESFHSFFCDLGIPELSPRIGWRLQEIKSLGQLISTEFHRRHFSCTDNDG